MQGVCEILKIKEPEVSVDPFLPGTTLACYRNGKIYIKKISHDPDTYFSIAHELRHAWQMENGWSFTNYKTSGQLSVEEYNSQPVEIDAHAFSVVILTDLFGLEPQFYDFPMELKAKIMMRAGEIAKEL